jgi:hypothetical protein
MKALTNSGDFTGSRIRISNSGGTSQKNTLIQPLKKQPVYHLPLQIFFNFSPSSPAFGTICRITGGRNKHFEGGFKISTGKCFHRSKQKLEFPFSP